MIPSWTGEGTVPVGEGPSPVVVGSGGTPQFRSTQYSSPTLMPLQSSPTEGFYGMVLVHLLVVVDNLGG